MWDLIFVTALCFGFITGYLAFVKELKSSLDEICKTPALPNATAPSKGGQGLETRLERAYQEQVSLFQPHNREGEGTPEPLNNKKEGLQSELGSELDHSCPSIMKGGHKMIEPYVEPVGVELIKAPIVVGEDTLQEMQVNDLELEIPAIKIRHITTSFVDVTTEVIQDKVILQGIIHKQVFFVGEDEVVHHQSEDIPFSTFLEIPGAEPGMEVQVDFETPHVEAQLIDEGQILHQKIVFEVFIKVTQIEQIFVETGEGPVFLIDRVTGENQVQELIESELELDPPAIKISEIEASIVDLETEVINDKVIVQGVIHKQVFFVGEDNLEHHQSEDLPFSSFVDIPGAQPGMHVQVSPVIEHIKAELAAGGELLLQEIVLELFVKVTESVQVQLVLGEDSLLKLPQVVGENVIQTLKESTFELPQPAIKIREIDTFVQELEAVVIENKVILQGIIQKQIFFIDEDNVERHQEEILPFSLFIDIPGAEPGMEAVVFPTIEHVKAELNEAGTLLHQKIVLEFLVKVTETVQVTVVEPVPPYEPNLE